MVGVALCMMVVALASYFYLPTSQRIFAEGKQADWIKLPQESPLSAALEGMVTKPQDLDLLTKELGFPSHLFNIYAAAPVDLSAFGIGSAVYIPVAISEREGGRPSLFYLKPGEETLAGIYTTNDGMILHYVTRETGDTFPAREGDIYSERMTSRSGEVIYEGRGTLKSIDPRTGVGELQTEGTAVIQGTQRRITVVVIRTCGSWSYHRETIIIVIVRAMNDGIPLAANLRRVAAL